MRVLYITSHFDVLNSSAAVRNTALVYGLLANGHCVDVLTVFYPEEKRFHALVEMPRCHIYRTKLNIANLANRTSTLQWKINNSNLAKLKKVVKELLFFPDVFAKWPKLVNPNEWKDYDVFISSSDFKTSHFVGLKLKQFYPNVRWIQIWGDPWGFDSTVTWITKFRAKFYEASLLKKADKVVYVSELTYKAICKQYPALTFKLNYIPRSYLKEVFHHSDKKNKKFYKIIYTGSLGNGREFDVFLSEVDRYNATHDIMFQVCFYGGYADSLVSKLKKYACTEIHSDIAYNEVLKVYESGDALLFISNDVNSTQIPGKLFDYMGTDLPIICVLSGNVALRDFLRQYSKCIVFNNDFLFIVSQILGRQFLPEQRFSPLNVAKEVLG